MADWQERIEDKIDAMNATLVRNTVSLEEHVKRTNILEDEVKKEKAARAAAILPLQARYDAQNSIKEFAVSLTKLVAVAATLVALLSHFHLL